MSQLNKTKQTRSFSFDSEPPTPKVNKQRTFEYMTEDDDEFIDDYKMSPKSMLIHENIQIKAIQKRLKQWIGSTKTMNLSQFTELMKKMVPHINNDIAQMLFNRVDRFHNGQIGTKQFISNPFLAKMILKLFDSESNGNNATNDDKENESRNEIAVATMTIKELQSWIKNFGQPAIEKVEYLERMLNILENERNEQLKLTNQQSQKMSILGNKLSETQSTTGHLLNDNRNLSVSLQQSNDKWQKQQNKLKEMSEECKNYKKILSEMSVINEKYVEKNKECNEEKIKLEEECQSLRELILKYEHDTAMQYETSRSVIEKLQNEVKFIKTELQNYKNDESVKDKVEKEFEDNDLQKMMDLTGMNKTITLNRENLNEDIEEKEKDKSSSNTSTSVRKKHWYSMYQRQRSEDDLYDGGAATDEYYDEHGHAIIVHSMDTSSNHSNMSQQSMVNEYMNEQIFEEAVRREIRVDLEKKIKDEMSEDFEIRMKQKEIEYELKMNEFKQQMIEKYEAKLNNDDMDEKEEMDLPLLKSMRNRNSVEFEFGNNSGNEIGTQTEEIETKSAEEKFDFCERIKALFGESTLMWSFSFIR